ncbi:MAG: phosphatase PAP2 family protein [Marinifilaceae bacterium]|jgi:undecaprenyl-diphosphatase|nr:phosphatase PAP2 family protein [Marinifilaceae bacterium]
MEALVGIDSQLFLWFNSFNSHFWDILMMFVTRKEFWIAFYLLILYQIIKIKTKESAWWIIGILVLVLLSDQISSSVFKNLFERLRPSHNPDLQNLVHIVKDYRGGKFGFVSAHSANAFGFALFTSLIFKNRIYTFIIFGWAILVAYSRIYLGVHYPGDIIGGMLLGLTLAYGLYSFIKYKLPSKSLNYRNYRGVNTLTNSSALLVLYLIIVQLLCVGLVVRKLISYGVF